MDGRERPDKKQPVLLMEEVLDKLVVMKTPAQGPKRQKHNHFYHDKIATVRTTEIKEPDDRGYLDPRDKYQFHHPDFLAKQTNPDQAQNIICRECCHSGWVLYLSSK